MAEGKKNSLEYPATTKQSMFWPEGFRFSVLLSANLFVSRNLTAPTASRVKSVGDLQSMESAFVCGSAKIITRCHSQISNSDRTGNARLHRHQNRLVRSDKMH
jgi:hypothetical protein